MTGQRFILLVGKMWTDAHPAQAKELQEFFDLRTFDLLNAAQSIKTLEGIVVDATVIRLEWIDSITPYIHALENAGTPILHVIASQQKTSDFPNNRLKELGLCGLITETDDVPMVVESVNRIISTCTCKPGDSAFSRKVAALSAAFEKVEANEVDKRIVTLVAEGLSNDEIAQSIFFSAKTVRNHLSEVLKSTGLRNRTELALAWRRFSVDKDLQHTRY